MKLDLSGLAQFRASELLAPEGAPSEPGVPVAVALNLIDLDPGQPRRSMRECELAELAASIREVGVLEPVSLRRVGGRFVVNRGERRVRACRLAGLASVPAFVDDRGDAYVQVIENLHREDLSPFDLARFVADREAAGESRAEIARRLHKPRSFVSEVAALAQAPDVVKSAYDSGRVKDLRVLYRLARLHRDQREMPTELAEQMSLTREGLDAIEAGPRSEPGQRAAVAPLPVAAEPAPPPAAVARPSRALRVVMGRRSGRLALSIRPAAECGRVWFDDGTCEDVELGALQLVRWAQEDGDGRAG